MRFQTKTLLYGATILTATQIFSQLTSFAFRVVLARLVDAEGMGLYTLIMPVYAVTMSIAAFGLTVAVARLSAAFTAKGNHIAVRQLVRMALWLFLLILGVICVAVIPFSDWISVHLLGDARTRLGLLILLPCILFTGIENICKHTFYGLQVVEPPAIAEVIEQLLRTAAVLSLLVVLRPAYKEWMVGVIVIGMVICEIVSAALLFYLYRRHMKKVPWQGQELPRRQLFADMMTIAIPVSGAHLIANLLGSINTIIIPGRLMVSGVGQAEALSAYGVAFGMTLPLTTLPSVFVIPLSLILMPRVAQSVALGDERGARDQIEKALRLAATLVLPACLVLLPLGEPITQLLFHHPQAGQFMELLAITQIFGCFQYLMGSLLNGLGKQKQAAVNLLVSDAIQLALTWVLVAMPEWRLLGFVYAFLGTTALGAALNVWYAARAVGLNLSLDRWLLRPLFAAVVSMGGAYAAMSWFGRWGLAGLWTPLAALGVSVCICIVLNRALRSAKPVN